MSEFLEDTRTQKEKNNDEWYEMYNKLLLHIENNKQLPKNTCEDEKLWYWIGTQKQKFKNRKLSQEYIDKLEEISIWWWTEIHQAYLIHKKWFEDNPNLKCPNPECECNTKNSKTSFKYIQYNADNMRYIYICNTCGQKWNN